MIYLLIPISFILLIKWKLEQWDYKQYRLRNPETNIEVKTKKNIPNEFLEYWELTEEEDA